VNVVPDGSPSTTAETVEPDSTLLNPPDSAKDGVIVTVPLNGEIKSVLKSLAMVPAVSFATASIYA